MGATASQITSLTIVYLTVYSGADQRKHQSSASLAFMRGIHRRPVNSPHIWPVTLQMFLFDDVIVEVGRLQPVGLFDKSFHSDNALYVVYVGEVDLAEYRCKLDVWHHTKVIRGFSANLDNSPQFFVNCGLGYCNSTTENELIFGII